MQGQVLGGEQPITGAVIQLYAVQGFRRFLLATGYKGELIERFAAECAWPEGVSVECEDTGLETPTGGRIKLLGSGWRARSTSARRMQTGWPTST